MLWSFKQHLRNALWKQQYGEEQIQSEPDDDMGAEEKG